MPEPIFFSAEDRDVAGAAMRLLARIATCHVPSPAKVPLAGTATLKGAKAAAVAKAAKARPRSQPYTTAQRDRALAKVRKHAKAKHKNPSAAAAAEMGLPQTTIRRWARDAGLA